MKHLKWCLAINTTFLSVLPIILLLLSLAKLHLLFLYTTYNYLLSFLQMYSQFSNQTLDLRKLYFNSGHLLMLLYLFLKQKLITVGIFSSQYAGSSTICIGLSSSQRFKYDCSQEIWDLCWVNQCPFQNFYND